MKKSVLILGRQGSGKTSKAKEIAKDFQSDEVVIIPFRGDEPFHNQDHLKSCTEKTKLIIVEELWSLLQVGYFLQLISQPLIIKTEDNRDLAIHPIFVITCQWGLSNYHIRKAVPEVFHSFEVFNLNEVPIYNNQSTQL